MSLAGGDFDLAGFQLAKRNSEMTVTDKQLANLRPFQPGQSGNVNGRPLGSRTAFSAAFLRDLAETWAEHGKATMVHTARVNPEVYFATCARLIPKDVQLTIEQTTPRGLDADDLAILRAIKAELPSANSQSPEQVLTFVRSAIRAHSAPTVEALPATYARHEDIDD
jgi:hypothetical protein